MPSFCSEQTVQAHASGDKKRGHNFFVSVSLFFCRGLIHQARTFKTVQKRDTYKKRGQENNLLAILLCF